MTSLISFIDNVLVWTSMNHAASLVIAVVIILTSAFISKLLDKNGKIGNLFTITLAILEVVLQIASFSPSYQINTTFGENSELTCSVSSSLKVHNVSCHYVDDKQDMIEIRIDWKNNSSVYNTLIGISSDTYISADQIEEAMNTYPDIWRNQLNTSTTLETTAVNYVTSADLNTSEIFVLLLHLDRGFNVVGSSIVEIYLT